MIYLSIAPTKRQVGVVDADIAGAFDHSAPGYLLRKSGNCPARALLRPWLKAGYVARNVCHDTETGTPQGGVLSPLLATSARDGREQHLVERGDPRTVVRDADDLVGLGETFKDARRASGELGHWLRERRREYSAAKTRSVASADGCACLGVNVRRYALTPHRPRATKKWKLMIKPSEDAVRRSTAKRKEEGQKARGQQRADHSPRLNRRIRGGANDHRTVVSAPTFPKLDAGMWGRAWRYAQRRPPDKPGPWCLERYGGKRSAQHDDRWVCGDQRTGQGPTSGRSRGPASAGT
jgi:RNA-directed DNA polymerase